LLAFINHHLLTTIAIFTFSSATPTLPTLAACGAQLANPNSLENCTTGCCGGAAQLLLTCDESWGLYYYNVGAQLPGALPMVGWLLACFCYNVVLLLLLLLLLQREFAETKLHAEAHVRVGVSDVCGLAIRGSELSELWAM